RPDRVLDRQSLLLHGQAALLSRETAPAPSPPSFTVSGRFRARKRDFWQLVPRKQAAWMSQLT
ncbi:hypothetical protein WDZ92_43285, partial [Nostoc sp. NIES-2111]